MVQLTLATGNRLLFDLNLQHRLGTQWDPSHAIRLFEYCREKGYGKILDWELGNGKVYTDTCTSRRSLTLSVSFLLSEPDWYDKPGQAQLSGKQIGEDFLNLRRLMNAYPSLKSGRMVGPVVVNIPEEIVEG